MSGLQRYIAVCLLSGYVWLGFSGLLAVTIGPQGAGFLYDAMLHAIFVGYVFSMVFGHAPIILPAVIGTQLVYHPGFYLPLTLLHLSLLVRISGDLGYSVNMRLAGGLLNAASILLFLGLVVFSVLRAVKVKS